MNQRKPASPRLSRTTNGLAAGRFPAKCDHVLLTAAGLAAAATSAGAFEAADLLGFRAGPVVIKPQFTSSAGYNDNIYSSITDSPLGRTDDFLFMLSPGVLMQLGKPEADKQLSLTYQFSQYLYLENTQNNSGNHAISLSGNMKGARASNTTTASFQLLDSLMTGQDYASSSIDAPNRRNVQRNYYNFGDTISYELSPKSTINGGGSFNMQKYPGGLGSGDARYRDTTSWGVFGGYQRAVSEKVSATSRLSYGQSNQQANGLGVGGLDQQNMAATVGATGSITPKLSGNFNVGYQYNWYDGDQGSQGGIIAGVGLTQQFSERTSATLSYNRSSSLSSSGSSSPTTVNGAALGVQHALGTRRPVVLSAGVSYSLTDYINNDRTQEYLSVTAGASYQFRSWASAFLSYSYNYGTYPGFSSGNVNFTDQPYYVNQVTLGINIGLK